ncbi:MAG: hypothetical protein CMF96_05895 [Candidatus Marinimicrobia bacterium]|nr:hypothetical protein [Candidatus Neomarinimicrobiota bacterium]
MQKYRIFSLFFIHVLILVHVAGFGQEYIGSVDFQEFFHSFLKIGKINAGVILVFFALLSTLIFGRFFCGWACHFGAIQELSWFILQKLNITPKTINSRLVFILPIFILLHFYLIPNLDHAFNNPWVFSIELNKPNIWAFLPGLIIGLLTFFIDGFLIVYFLGRKGFCRFICPWGAFLKLPSALAIYKVRNTGGCINSGNCTRNCPIGIDVNYEINSYNKVVNTNCTNCMICTEGCPTSALKFSYENPLNERYNLIDFFNGENIYKSQNTKQLFTNLRSKDILFFIFTLVIGFSIDGLFSMGHFLSFGIAIITSYNILKEYRKNIFKLVLSLFVILILVWSLSIKYSIHNGVDSYLNANYTESIKYLKFVTDYYPNKIGRYYIYLSDSYYETGMINQAKFYAEIANSINPNHESVHQLFNKIYNNTE